MLRGLSVLALIGMMVAAAAQDAAMRPGYNLNLKPTGNFGLIRAPEEPPMAKVMETGDVYIHWPSVERAAAGEDNRGLRALALMMLALRDRTYREVK